MILKMKAYTLKALVENVVALKDMSAYFREHMGTIWEKLLQKNILLWSFVILGYFFLSKIIFFLIPFPIYIYIFFFLQNVSIKLWDAPECTIEISWDIWSGFRNVFDFMTLNKCLPLPTAELKKSKSMPSREPPQHEIMVRWSDNLPNEERSMR